MLSKQIFLSLLKKFLSLSKQIPLLSKQIFPRCQKKKIPLSIKTDSRAVKITKKIPRASLSIISPINLSPNRQNRLEHAGSISFPEAAFLLVSTKEARPLGQSMSKSSDSKSDWLLYFTGSLFESEVSKTGSEIWRSKKRNRNAIKCAFNFFQRKNTKR